MFRWCLGHGLLVSCSCLCGVSFGHTLHVWVMFGSCLGQCLGHSSVFDWCLGHASVVSGACFACVSVVFWFCLTNVCGGSRQCLAVSWSCFAGVLVMFPWCLGHVSLVSLSLGGVLLMLGWDGLCFGSVSVLFPKGPTLNN